MLHGELHKMGPVASLICGLITVLVLGSLYFLQTRLSSECDKTSTWLRCNGTIESTYTQRDGSTYACYEYSAGGKEHINSRIYYDQMAAGSYLPDSVKYVVGQKVAVFYDPKSPGESVLIQGSRPHKIDFAPYALGLFLSAGLVIAGVRKLNQPA